MPATGHVCTERVVDLASLFFKQNEDVHSTVLEGESVLLNLSTGRYYTLNAVGSIVWDQCTGERSLADILTVICDRFNVTTQQVEDDLVDLVAQLTEEKLIQTERR